MRYGDLLDELVAFSFCIFCWSSNILHYINHFYSFIFWKPRTYLYFWLGVIKFFGRFVNFDIFLKIEPVASVKPKFPSLDKSRTFESKQFLSVTLLCQAQAFPVPAFRWNTYIYNKSVWYSLCLQSLRFSYSFIFNL